MIRSRLFIFALLACLNSVLLGTSTVLCVCSGGHVAFEIIGTRCCEDDSKQPEQAGPPSATDESSTTGGTTDRCGRCIDLSLAELFAPGSAWGQADQPERGEFPPVPQAAELLPPPSCTVDCDAWVTGPSGPRGSLRHMQTVVLRC